MELLYEEDKKEKALGIASRPGSSGRIKHNFETHSVAPLSDVRVQYKSEQMKAVDYGKQLEHMAAENLVIQRKLDFNTGGLSVTYDAFKEAIYSSGSSRLVELFEAVDGVDARIYYLEHATPIGFGPSGGELTLNIPKDIWKDEKRRGPVLGHELQHAYDRVVGGNKMRGFDSKIETELNAWCSECIVAMQVAHNPEEIGEDTMKLMNGFRNCVLNRSYHGDRVDSSQNAFLSRLAHYCVSYDDSQSGKSADELLNEYLQRGNNRDKVIDACWAVFEKYEEIFHPD